MIFGSGRWGVVVLFLGLNRLQGQMPTNQHAIGWVEAIHGRWIDDAHGGRPLAVHLPVYLDSKIRVETSRSDYSIKIRVYDAPKEVPPFSCGVPGTCPGPIDIEGKVSSVRLHPLREFQGVIDALRSVLVGPPPGGESFISRGGSQSAAGPQDEIVVLEQGASGVSKMLAHLANGPYTLIVSDLVHERSPQSVHLNWSEGHQPLLRLGPGLYHLSLTHLGLPATQESQVGDRLWLVVNPTAYERATSFMREGEKYVDSLEEASPN